MKNQWNVSGMFKTRILVKNLFVTSSGRTNFEMTQFLENRTGITKPDSNEKPVKGWLGGGTDLQWIAGQNRLKERCSCFSRKKCRIYSTYVGNLLYLRPF